MELPQIGSMVQWFNQANPTMSPQAAMVIGHQGQLLILNTIDVYGVSRVRTQVRHIEEQFLKDNQSWRINYGAWRALQEPKAADEDLVKVSKKNAVKVSMGQPIEV